MNVTPSREEARPSQLKAWLESLPQVHSLDAGRRFAEKLALLNRAPVDAGDRIQMLEMLRPASAAVLDEIEALFARSEPPLGARQREAIAQFHALARELAAAWKIAAIELQRKPVSIGGCTPLPALLLRAAESCAASLRASYKSYTLAPAGLWRQLHEIYLYAEQEGVATQAADPETNATVFDAYSECLLLSLTDPYRLVQGEVDRIHAHLRRHRARVTLGQAPRATAAGAHFLVPCDTDKPPRPAMHDANADRGPRWRLLDANPLVDELRHEKRALEAGGVPSATVKALGDDPEALLGKLITLWGDPPRRASGRRPREATIAICVGIKSIAHFVTMESRVDPGMEAEAIRRGITIPLIAIPDDEISRSMLVQEWDVVDSSDGGLKARRIGRTLQPICVGEVIGIRIMGRPRWTVGVVRWITTLRDGMEFGIQYLASAAEAAWVQPTAEPGSAPKQCLLIVSEDESVSLIAPHDTYSARREYEIEQDGVASSVRAGRLVEKNGRFELFRVAPR